MKAIKLKPLFFPNDDIYVSPPGFAEKQSVSVGKLTNRALTEVNQVISILRGRRLKKQRNQSKPILEDEKESVKKLSEWKRNGSPKSPIMRKFTFKRVFTLSNVNESRGSPVRPVSTMVQRSSPLKTALLESLVSKVYKIISDEKQKKKHHDEEMKKASDLNLEYENQMNDRINRLKKEIKGLKIFIRESAVNLNKINMEYQALIKKYEANCSDLALMEAHELMFKEKGKKGGKPGEVKDYFIKKEKIRVLKQELHKNFQDEKEKFLNKIENETKGIEVSEYQRMLAKKDLKQYREQIIMLYCRALKDGKDIRADGLRWAVKALWKMSEPIPISAFPKFLDEESAYFILKTAEKELELIEYEEALNNLREEIKNHRPSSAMPSAKILFSSVKKRLKDIAQCSVGQSIGKSPTTMETQTTVREANKENFDSLNEISDIRQRISRTQEFLKEFTEQEIKRVTEQYQNHPGYSEEVGLYHVIKCLVGDKVREFNKYTHSSSLAKKNKSILII